MDTPGSMLRVWLVQHDLTQIALAESVGISRALLNQIACGKARVTVETATRLELVTCIPAQAWLDADQAQFGVRRRPGRRKRRRLPSRTWDADLFIVPPPIPPAPPESPPSKPPEPRWHQTRLPHELRELLVLCIVDQILRCPLGHGGVYRRVDEGRVEPRPTLDECERIFRYRAPKREPAERRAALRIRRALADAPLWRPCE